MGRIKSRIKNSSENNHISIDSQENPVNKLLDDSYSKKRIQELLNDTNLIQVIMDSNQQMRFAVVNELEKILSYKVPIILFDRTYNIAAYANQAFRKRRVYADCRQLYSGGKS